MTNESQLADALRHLEEAETRRDNELFAIAFIRVAGPEDVLQKLSRYRVSIERSRNHALKTFERLQAAHGKGPEIRRRGLNAWGVLSDPRAR